MFLSRTMTAPTLARPQVDRSATCRVMVMKYWSHVGRLLMARRLSGKDLERFGHERQQEQQEARERAQRARRPERLPVVERRRVPEAQHQRQDRGPDDPPRPAVPPEPGEEGH